MIFCYELDYMEIMSWFVVDVITNPDGNNKREHTCCKKPKLEKPKLLPLSVQPVIVQKF